MCLGKALALVPDLSEAGAPRPTAAMLAGAEANVAVGLAGAGVAAAWVGRWARDELGAFLHAELARSDVDVGDVVIDPHPARWAATRRSPSRTPPVNRAAA